MIAFASSRWLLPALLVVTACQSEPAVVPPPPLPQASVAPAAEPEPAAAKGPAAHTEPASAQAEVERKSERAPSPSKPSAKASKAASKDVERPPGWGAAYVPPRTPEPAPVVAPTPAPTPVAKPAPAAPAPVAAKPKTKVTIPRTDHVHVEIPSGLQADLDADPRMQPWVEKVIAIADGCHAKARASTGTIEAAVTMHENDRPDVDMRSLPAQLGSLVACATGSLMRTRMPFFTGREGTRYAVKIVFD